MFFQFLAEEGCRPAGCAAAAELIQHAVNERYERARKKRANAHALNESATQRHLWGVIKYHRIYEWGGVAWQLKRHGAGLNF